MCNIYTIHYTLYTIHYTHYTVYSTITPPAFPTSYFEEEEARPMDIVLPPPPPLPCPTFHLVLGLLFFFWSNHFFPYETIHFIVQFVAMIFKLFLFSRLDLL